MTPKPSQPARRKAPTIIDIARLAGTSKSTVSNVLRGKEHVEATTRERVLRVSEELGYRANIAARHLRQAPKALGVVVGDLRNPFDAEIAAFIEQSATAAAHSILLVTTNSSAERERARLRALLEHRVAAVLFVSFSGNASVVATIPPDTPCLFVSCQSNAGISIGVDERRGGRIAVEHLAALGHRRIAYVSTSLAHQPRSDAARFAGYRSVTKSLGIELADLLTVRLRAGDHGSLSPRERIEALLKGPKRPTAVFAASDFTAIEVMDAADTLGLEVPRDLSIVGFDDIAISKLSRIALTTVVQPAAELAQRAVEIAIDAARAKVPVANVRLRPRLVIRDSTAPPRPASSRQRSTPVAAPA